MIRNVTFATALIAALAGPVLAAEQQAVVRQQVDDRKAVIATVEPVRELKARARIGGTITKLVVREGDRVAAGDQVALVVDHVEHIVEAARTDLGLSVFAGSRSESFAAIGDDHRLLIVVKRGRAWNSGHGRTAEVYPTHAVLLGDRAGRLTPGAFPYDVLTA